MVLLLGSTGLLGGNVLRILVSRGEEVLAPVRNPAALERVRKEIPGAKIIAPAAHIDRLAELLPLCRKFKPDAIINCAGTTDMSTPSLEGFLEMNYRLCTLLPTLMKECGIRRLVHTSSANTIRSGSALQASDESAPFEGIYTRSFYAQSKKMGEDVLLSFARRHDELHIIILNPGFMIGPYDNKPSSGKLLLAGYRKPLMAAPSGAKNFVHVRDAAAAAVNALQMGRNGGRYLITGELIKLRDFYRLQAKTMGYRQLCITLPDALVRLAGCFGDLLRKTGVRTMLGSVNCAQLLLEEHYDNSAAVRELLLPHSPIEAAIREFFATSDCVRKN